MATKKVAKPKPEREYVTAISIQKGIITLIEPDGQIAMYRQRGIEKLTESQVAEEIKSGRLSATWYMAQPLPNHYSSSCEEPRIMGRARASYPFGKEK